VDHPEQPTLACVVDYRSRKKLATRGDRGVTCRPDQLINIVGDAVVIQELPDCGRKSRFEIIIDFVLARAKAGAAQQMLDDMLTVSNPLPFGGIASILHDGTPRRHHTPPDIRDATLF
jgi:hypothetical protein